eukprot:6200378-Pleurochrysis_carterae.AAC.4
MKGEVSRASKWGSRGWARGRAREGRKGRGRGERAGSFGGDWSERERQGGCEVGARWADRGVFSAE